MKCSTAIEPVHYMWTGFLVQIIFEPQNLTVTRFDDKI